MNARELLLQRKGLVFLEPAGERVDERFVRAFELDLAALGYVLSARLHTRLSSASLDTLVGFRAWVLATLGAQFGANQRHVPLFRHFPDGVPDDTRRLFYQKVLVHFLQAEGQPCLFCRRVGTTHVLDPCQHVVCDRCFDGANDSACPVCEQPVNRASPFFKPSVLRAATHERVAYKLLDLGESLEHEVKALFRGACERTQALSPDDRDALAALAGEFRGRAPTWLPDVIPVRENVAIVFGTLLRVCDPAETLAAARPYLKTATDVLRVLAAYSGADASLQGESRCVQAEAGAPSGGRWWGKLAGRLAGPASTPRPVARPVTVRVKRFKMGRLGRPLRRALCALLESFEPERLVEDVLRHRSYWVWAGEFLHPHEYAARFPNVARAFAVARQKGPRGEPAPAFRGYHTRLDAAARAGDVGAMLALLEARPGELARRFDHALRLAGDDDAMAGRVVDAFAAKAGAFATPVLLTLHAALPTRATKAPRRIYWPKGPAARGVSGPDERPTLSPTAIRRGLEAVDAELLRRFGEKTKFGHFIIDAALDDVVVPFHERTASRAAVALPRGSRLKLPEGKIARLFLHWCEPERGGSPTDVDLSVGFYDAAWRPVGVCSYYQLSFASEAGVELATSAGDLRDAPFPAGATEFVDVYRERALAEGVRYAVMVVSNYAGLSFAQLERGFAGLMLRDDVKGKHFDPRAVELKFSLAGESGVCLPFVFDLAAGTLHWLDVYAKGELECNDVASSQTDITTICPELIAYFEGGSRPSLGDLARLHAAARAGRVWRRGAGGAASLFVRGPDEGVAAFYARLARHDADEPLARMPRFVGAPVFAALYRGDVELPAESAVYALFRERTTPTLAASDLLA